jgi:hypothetical protein
LSQILAAEPLSKEVPRSEPFRDFMVAHRDLDTLATELSLGDVDRLAERLRNPFPDHAIIVEAMATISAFM